MKKSPCFPFYPSDFFGDVKVRVMTGEEQAFYLLLLANIWEFDSQISIPNDAKVISTLLKISEEKWETISGKILACLEEKNGRLLSKRLKREKDKQDNYRKQQSIKGVKSAEKRSTTVQPRFNHGSTGGVTGSQPEVNSSISKPIPKPIKKKKKVDAFVLPEWIPDDLWAAYIDVRIKKRAAKTGNALNLVIQELEKIRNEYHQDPVEVLKKSVRSGWTDVYPLKDQGGNGSGKTVRPERRSPYVICPRCHAEYLENEKVDIGGVLYCPKCPQAREGAKRLAKAGYAALMERLSDRGEEEGEESPPFETVSPGVAGRGA